MDKFIKKLVLFLFVSFVILEVLCMIFVDPIYFYLVNTYNEKANPSLKNVLFNDTEHVDFLFVGSSRIPATINPALVKKLSYGKVAVNGGRGYATPGIHYQALKNKLLNHPDYLRGSAVLLEYPGSEIYSDNFAEDRLRVYEPVVKTDKAMPYLLIPHLSIRSLITYLKESPNSFGVKVDMVFQYWISIYRTQNYINEKFSRLKDYHLFKKKEVKLVSEGGIRNDKIEFAKKKAIQVAQKRKQKIIDKPALSPKILDESTIAALHAIITENGGTLYLYEMPLHSIQKDIHASDKANRNKQVFENWLGTKKIPIVYNPNFKYQDSDFPDTWHLSKGRRNEFTSLLYQELISLKR